jgi:hypothetical protein
MIRAFSEREPKQHGLVGVQQLVGGRQFRLKFIDPPGHRIECVSLVFRRAGHPIFLAQDPPKTQKNRAF